MPTNPDAVAAGNAASKQPYTLYAANGRVYARNAAQKVIDLGPLTRQEGGWCYQLEGNGESGAGLFTPEEALRDIAGRLHFLWLDGQFTAVADARHDSGFSLDGATELNIELDELKPGEPMVDATV
jgi:hypothetical protein